MRSGVLGSKLSEANEYLHLSSRQQLKIVHSTVSSTIPVSVLAQISTVIVMEITTGLCNECWSEVKGERSTLQELHMKESGGKREENAMFSICLASKGNLLPLVFTL